MRIFDQLYEPEQKEQARAEGPKIRGRRSPKDRRKASRKRARVARRINRG